MHDKLYLTDPYSCSEQLLSCLNACKVKCYTHSHNQSEDKCTRWLRIFWAQWFVQRKQVHWSVLNLPFLWVESNFVPPSKSFVSLQTSCSSLGPLRYHNFLRIFYQKLSLLSTCLNELTARNKDSAESKATTVATCIALQQLGFTLCTPSLLLLMFLSACVRTRLMSLPCQRWRKLNTTLAVHCNKIYKKIRKNDPDGHSKLSNITVRRSFALRKWLALPRYVVGAVLAVKILRRAIALREA